MSDIYKHWNSDVILKKYLKPRPWANRFRSEVYFLEKIMRNGLSVLDIGCATGDLYHGLKEKYSDVSYTGIDGASNLIARAESLAPGTEEATFILSNVFDSAEILNNRQFDIVTATGVFQHEPQSEKLLQFMIEHTKEGGYILFDLKLFHSHKTVCDIKNFYIDHPEPIYYVVFNLNDVVNLVLKQHGVAQEMEVYGYYSGIHPGVRLLLPVEEEVCSAHVLLRRSKQKKSKE